MTMTVGLNERSLLERQPEGASSHRSEGASPDMFDVFRGFSLPVLPARLALDQIRPSSISRRQWQTI